MVQCLHFIVMRFSVMAFIYDVMQHLHILFERDQQFMLFYQRSVEQELECLPRGLAGFFHCVHRIMISVMTAPQ